MKKIITYIIGVLFCVFLLNANVNAATIGIGSNSRSTAVYYNMGDTIVADFPYSLDNDANSDGNSYYVFSLPYKAKIQINASTNSHQETIGIKLFDVNGEKIETFYSEDKNNLGYQVIAETWVLPAGTYYMNITSLTSGWSSAYASVRLDVLLYEDGMYKMASYMNNSLSQAVDFTIGNYLSGHVTQKDYYRFQVFENMIFIVEGSQIGNTYLRLFDSGGNKISDSFSSQDAVVSYGYYLQPGTYYMSVEDATFNSSTVYDLVTSMYKTSRVSIKKVTRGKSSVKVKYATGQTNDKYQIQISRNKKFKNCSSFETTSKSIKLNGLKSKKKYYVRVRAYDNINGASMYGKWSKIKMFKTK
ncbi:MAG: fibronectin type III domain-containing protein [Lachnospiraceae bacterium]|nr:fibronectin type III domain-containing protein [Lachnospiraceae bacterium]